MGFNPPPPSSTGETIAFHDKGDFVRQFQSAPAFEHGGNPVYAFSRNVYGFQSAPAFEHGGNCQEPILLYGRLKLAVSIRPRLRARGKRCRIESVGREREVSIRPRLRARGKRERGPAGEPTGLLFQSAPAFEHGGNTFSPVGSVGAGSVSIRPRLRARGKLITARHSFVPHKFQSAPAFEHGGNTRIVGPSKVRYRFNPPPPSSTGETL